MYFKHPDSGNIVKVAGPNCNLWFLIFSFFYCMFKGLWGHAVLSFIAFLCTLGFGIIIYAFFIHGIIRKKYIVKGWSEVLPDSKFTD